MYVIISRLICVTLELKHAGRLHFPDFSRYWSKMCKANGLMRVDFIPHRSTTQCLFLCMTCHGCAACWGVVGEPCEIQTWETLYLHPFNSCCSTGVPETASNTSCSFAFPHFSAALNRGALLFTWRGIPSPLYWQSKMYSNNIQGTGNKSLIFEEAV